MVEKELKKGSDFDTGDPILATAEIEIINRIRSNSTNKTVFVIRVQDNFSDNERVFISDKILETNNYVEITGIELPSKKQNKITQKIDKNSQVLNNANKENLINIKFPWHKINEIKNVSYQNKLQKKENK